MRVKMKNCIVMIFFLVATVTHAMENRPTFCCAFKGTDIVVIKGGREAIYEKNREVDVIVVGQNEQKQLDRTTSFGNGDEYKHDIIGSVVKKKRELGKYH